MKSFKKIKKQNIYVLLKVRGSKIINWKLLCSVSLPCVLLPKVVLVITQLVISLNLQYLNHNNFYCKNNHTYLTLWFFSSHDAGISFSLRENNMTPTNRTLFYVQWSYITKTLYSINFGCHFRQWASLSFYLSL